MWRVWERCKICPEFLWGSQNKWNHLEDDIVNKRSVLKWVIKEIRGGMEWINLAKGRDKWWAVVCTILNLWFQQNVRKYVISEDCSTTHNLYSVYYVLC